jgi:uncharacterized protein (TIGR03083 family)
LQVLTEKPVIRATQRSCDRLRRKKAVTVESFVSRAELLAKIQHEWETLQAYLETLTETQLTEPTDAGGWSVKDHLMHLAVWEDGIVALLEGESRRERMGIDEIRWKTPGYDQINEVIYHQHRHKSLEEVLQTFNDVHEQLIAKLQSMSDEELQLPYSYYQHSSIQNKPVIKAVLGTTAEHYAEHRAWIDAIVEGARR